MCRSKVAGEGGRPLRKEPKRNREWRDGADHTFYGVGRRNVTTPGGGQGDIRKGPFDRTPYPVPVHTGWPAGVVPPIFTLGKRGRRPTCLINHVKLANNPRSLNPIERENHRRTNFVRATCEHTVTRIGRPTTKGEGGRRPRDDTNQCGRNNKGASPSLSPSFCPGKARPPPEQNTELSAANGWMNGRNRRGMPTGPGAEWRPRRRRTDAGLLCGRPSENSSAAISLFARLRVRAASSFLSCPDVPFCSQLLITKKKRRDIPDTACWRGKKGKGDPPRPPGATDIKRWGD